MQNDESTTRHLAKYGETLIDNNYQIVPIKQGEKFPGISGWNALKSDKEHLSKWLSNGYKNGGVGVNTKFTPAIDIDCHCPEVVQKLVDWCEREIGKTVQRVGMAPKTLLVYRTDKPFQKMKSKKFENWLGQSLQVEVLGEGQQFVAFGYHKGAGKDYCWPGGDDISEISRDWLPELTEEKARALIEYFESLREEDWIEVGAGSAFDIVEQEDFTAGAPKPKLGVSLERVKRALSKIDSDDRDTWIQVGMALHHEGEGCVDWLALWDEWSQGSGKYVAGECEAKWSGFGKHHGVTCATVLKFGKDEAEAEEGPRDPLERFIDRYVYVEAGNRVCDLEKPPQYSIYEYVEFRNTNAGVRHLVPAPTKQDPDKEKLQAVSDSWVAHPDRETVRDCEYDPTGGRVIEREGLKFVNEFNMPSFDKCSDTSRLEVFTEHMEYLLPKKVEREWFISWIALNVQQPGRRSKVTPLLVSLPHGTGRGWVTELMEKLLGEWNCTKTKMKELAGEGGGAAFNEYLDRSLLCSIEEVYEGKRYGISDKIRDTLTENRLMVNKKFGGKKTQTIYVNFFLMTNHNDALALEENDRRINVFSGPKKPRNEAYYDKLYGWLHDVKNIACLHGYLMARDITGANFQRSFKTKARSNMIENNQSETEMMFRDLLENPPFKVMTLDQIIDYLEAQSLNNNVSIDRSVIKKLTQTNCFNYGQVRFEGRRFRVWGMQKNEELEIDQIKNILCLSVSALSQ